MEIKSFVFYRSWFDIVKTVEQTQGVDKAYEYIKSILELGLGEEYSTNDEFIKGIVTGACKESMLSCKNKYATAVSNGYKGGRPPKSLIADIHRLHEEGLSVMEIAEQLSTNTRFVEKTIKNDN